MGWGRAAGRQSAGRRPRLSARELRGARPGTQLTDSLTVLGGVFSGSPLPAGSDGSQLSNPSGIAFPLNTGVLAIAELQYSINGGVGADKPDPHGLPPGTYKLGGWYDGESFDDLRYDTFGVPLASDLSNGVPATHHGNYSIYALADQTIWRAPDGGRSVTAFLRPMFTTFQDRSLVSFSINGGLTLHQPFAGRDNDVFGLGFGVAQVSNGAANFDRDMQVFQPAVYTPVQGAETFLEATYQAQVLPSVVVQPDVQYIINPGGGIANPNVPYQRVKNELVFGIRTNITF